MICELKINFLLIYTTAWTNLKCIMLSEGVRFKRLHTLWLHSHDVLEKANYRDREREISGSQGLKMRGGSDYKRITWGNFLWSWSNGIVLCLDCSGYITLCICQNSQNITPKRVSCAVCESNDLRHEKTYFSKSNAIFNNIIAGQFPLRS